MTPLMKVSSMRLELRGACRYHELGLSMKRPLASIALAAAAVLASAVSPTLRVGRQLRDGGPGGDDQPHRWHLHEHHVAQGVLGVLGDADPDPAAVEERPLVVLGVPPVLGHVHGGRR